MKVLGISAGFHDAAITLIENENILYAGHSERYSKDKHDPHLNREQMQEALDYGMPDVIAFYERPLVKKLRQLYAGQYSDAFAWSDISVKQYIKSRFPRLKLPSTIKYRHYSHHLAHAASGFQTSRYQRATVVVIDAIGEWDSISIYGAEYGYDGKAKYTKLWGQKYPHSIGLFYSAMTDRVGLRPMDEEYILMGMAGYGRPKFFQDMMRDLVDDPTELTFKHNLHAGVNADYLGEDPDPIGDKHYHIAASAQLAVEVLIAQVMQKASLFNWSKNLVYTGGVALNCLANRMLGDYFDSVWIMPNPGDAGASVGAAALAYGRSLRWMGPYLGRNILGRYPVDGLMQELLTNKIVGVASGRAEFGPRALGNRSLLADPRDPDIKDKVNAIKHRQQFRPFAPVILEEQAHKHFILPKGFRNSPYMQVTAKCTHPEKYPAIVHVDGTSRVQTVSYGSKSGIRQLLEAWYQKTGCPMLLNTSLNVRGEPMVNDEIDARRFERIYGVKVIS